MPTESVQCGIPLAVTQTIPYALPTHVVRIMATVVVDVSPDQGTTWVAVSAVTNTGADISATHVRCTAATNCVLIANRFN